MAAYPDAAYAVAAPLGMREAAERFNRDRPGRPVSLKIGVHHGAAIAVTLNDELDYFGQTVNIASRVQERPTRGRSDQRRSMVLPGRAGAPGPYPAEERTAEFRGVGRPLLVRRIGGPGSAAPA
jgi:class 3 adenylate cyclase